MRTRPDSRPGSEGPLIRWGIVGFGDIAAKAVAPAICAHQQSELVAICRRDASKLAGYARQFQVPRSFVDYGEMLDAGGLDAIYVATPVHLHAPQTIAALERGLHVLVEKPMALTADEAAAMVEAAERAGLTLGIAFYHRLLPVNRRVHELVHSGELGDLVALHGNASLFFNPGPDDPKLWRTRAAQSGGGPLMDTGSHRLDIFHSLAGPAAKVAAFCDRRSIGGDVEDAATVMIKYASGVQATLSALWSANPAWSDYHVWCTGGHAFVTSVRGEELILERDGHSERMILPVPPLLDLALIEGFVEALEGRAELVLSGRDGLEVQLVIDAAYESAATGALVGLRGEGG